MERDTVHAKRKEVRCTMRVMLNTFSTGGQMKIFYYKHFCGEMILIIIQAGVRGNI